MMGYEPDMINIGIGFSMVSPFIKITVKSENETRLFYQTVSKVLFFGGARETRIHSLNFYEVIS
jgi:hypothetical protein